MQSSIYTQLVLKENPYTKLIGIDCTRLYGYCVKVFLVFYRYIQAEWIYIYTINNQLHTCHCATW